MSLTKEFLNWLLLPKERPELLVKQTSNNTVEVTGIIRVTVDDIQNTSFLDRKQESVSLSYELLDPETELPLLRWKSPSALFVGDTFALSGIRVTVDIAFSE